MGEGFGNRQGCRGNALRPPRARRAFFFCVEKTFMSIRTCECSSWPSRASFELLLSRSALRMSLRRGKNEPSPKRSGAGVFPQRSGPGSGANQLAREEGGFALGSRPATRLQKLRRVASPDQRPSLEETRRVFRCWVRTKHLLPGSCSSSRIPSDALLPPPGPEKSRVCLLR